MKKWLAASVLVLVFIQSYGCAVIGRSKDFRPFEQKSLAQVTPGKTTAQEVTQWFGAPSQVTKLSNGNAYIYSRKLNKTTGAWLFVVTLVNMDTQYDQVVFFLNDKDIVTHWGSSFNAAEASYGLPF